MLHSADQLQPPYHLTTQPTVRIVNPISTISADYGLEKDSLFTLGLSNLVVPCLDHAKFRPRDIKEAPTRLIKHCCSQDREKIPRNLSPKLRFLVFRVCHNLARHVTEEALSDHTPQTFVEACITDHWVHATASLPALNFSPPTPNSTSSCSTCATPHPDMSIFSWDRLEASCLFSPAYTFLHKVIFAEVSE